MPLLARSVGSGPVFFPRQGCLGHRPIHREPTPVDAVEGVVLRQPGLPEAQKEAVFHPGLEAVMRRGAWTKARGRKRVPLAAGSQHEADRIGAGPVGHAGPASAEAVGVRMRGQQRLHQGPKLVADGKASSRAGDALGPGPSSRLGLGGRLFLARLHTRQIYHNIHYSDRQ